jgi:hypothetical protein
MPTSTCTTWVRAASRNDTDQYVTVALDFPPLGSEALGNPRYADWPLLDQDKSRRYALAAALGLQEHAGQGNAETSPFFGGVSRYTHQQIADGYSFDRDFAGQARSAFGLNGTGTVLFEVRASPTTGVRSSSASLSRSCSPVCSASPSAWPTGRSTP